MTGRSKCIHFPFASIHATKWNKSFTSSCLLANVFLYTCAKFVLHCRTNFAHVYKKTFVACILANGKCIHLLRPVANFLFKLHVFFHNKPTKEINFRDRGSKTLQMKQKKFGWHISFKDRQRKQTVSKFQKELNRLGKWL